MAWRALSNSVVSGINARPRQTTQGDGPATGEEVEIRIAFTPAILLPADHYFFRPEVQVAGGTFLYLSAPRPLVPPATPFMGDLQAWIRNSDLAPDWLRIGTDIIGGTPAPTFNLAFSLTGATIAGTPGRANCRGQSVSGLSRDFGEQFDAAASSWHGDFPADGGGGECTLEVTPTGLLGTTVFQFDRS